MHQPLIQVSKNVDLSFYFLRTGIKRSHSVPSQEYMADDSSNRCFECLEMQLFEPMCESSHCRGEEWSVFGGWFSWFLGIQLANKWLFTTQNWLFCVVLVVWLRHCDSCSEKTGDHLLRSALLDLAHLETPIQSAAVYIRFHTRKST